MLVLSSLALSSILRRETSWRFSSSRRVLTWWLTRSSSLLRRPFWRRTRDTTGEENMLNTRFYCCQLRVNKGIKRETDANLDVLCVCRLQFLSEVRVCLQHLDHLSEIPVVVQTSVLRGWVVKDRSFTANWTYCDINKPQQTVDWEQWDHYPILLRHLLFNFLVACIAINRHWPDPSRDG